MSLDRNVLYVAAGHSLSQTRRLVLEHAGYTVTIAGGAEEALSALEVQSFQVLLIGVRIDRREAQRIIQAVRSKGLNIVVVVVASLRNAGADFVVPSMAGPEALLGIMGEALVKQHGHAVPDEGCFLFVDRERRYVHVTSGAADLLGYERGELIGHRIDEISDPDMQVEEDFQAYVRDRQQHGHFKLMRRDGSPMRIAYRAEVLEDGCMVSEISPS